MSYLRCQAMPAADGHDHVAYVEPETGNGRTDPGGSGHMHRIIAWHVDAGDDGHVHELQCPPDSGHGPGGGG